MKTPFLFPYNLKKIGWFLFIPGLALGILTMYFDYRAPFLDGGNSKTSLFDFTDHNFTNELASVLLMAGLMFVAFSRRKEEDEFTVHMRLDALLWAVYANTAMLMLCILMIYGGAFISVLVYNMFTIPVIYLLRFRYLLYKTSKDNQA